ncbi:MAG: thioredoxin domain-containing protein [Polyangiales bacterium]
MSTSRGNMLLGQAQAKATALTVVTDKTFEAEVMNSELPVLIEFGAAWCQPCKQIEPELVALQDELRGKAKIVKVDVDASPLLAQEFQVRGVPTFAVVHQGRLAGQPVSGARGRAQLRAMLEPVLPRSEASIRVEEFLKLAQTGRVVAIDTRDAASFGRAHIPGAMHLALADLPSKVDTLAATGKVPVLYCRSGGETKEVAEKLSEQGYPIAFIEGGFLAWELAGQAIERG